MIELKHIDKNYNAGTVHEMCLFKNFSLTIQSGEFVSVVGSNGSGKTTMLNLICGSIPVDDGEIFFDGKEITRLPEYERNKQIGRVFQNPAEGSCPSMTILENLSLADGKGGRFGLHPGTNQRRVERYREILRELSPGLEDQLDTPAGVLSGGQRQALSLAMATMTPVGLLILDEHTAALDPKTADRIMERTDLLVKEKKLTVLMVTHNLRYAADYGNRILMMHAGGIVLDKAGEEKKRVTVEGLLSKFNEISVECGN